MSISKIIYLIAMNKKDQFVLFHLFQNAIEQLKKIPKESNSNLWLICKGNRVIRVFFWLSCKS
jgi:hypothetical protein